jgi:hypothetical protein
MSSTALEPTFTHPRLKAFERRFGSAHLDLACYAAFPLALTPELLYCLRENFQPRSPWIAVADILLSLADPVGYRLYELEGRMRHELLSALKERFGEQQLNPLSDFMVAYIRASLATNDRAAEDLGAAPHWTALAYTRPQQAVRDIALALQEALAKENPSEWVKLTALVETYADFDPLLAAGFQPLLVLSRGLEAKARGDEKAAAEQLQPLGARIEVAGVTLEVPSVGGGEPLQSFSFETVTVNRRGKIIKRETRSAQYFSETLESEIQLEMVAIPGGKFRMGTDDEEIESISEPNARNMK